MEITISFYCNPLLNPPLSLLLFMLFFFLRPNSSYIKVIKINFVQLTSIKRALLSLCGYLLQVLQAIWSGPTKYCISWYQYQSEWFIYKVLPFRRVEMNLQGFECPESSQDCDFHRQQGFTNYLLI